MASGDAESDTGQRRADVTGRALRRVSMRSRIARRHALLALQRHDLLAVRRDDRDLVGRRVEAAIGGRHVVGDDHVDFLRVRLARARSTTSPVSAAKPTSTGAAPPSGIAHRPEVGQDVLRPLERQRQRRVCLRDLVRGTAAPACSPPPRQP